MTVVSRDFRDLRVWERAHQIAIAAYRVTTMFPREEAYGMTSQIRRAASSVPANIAEGCAEVAAISSGFVVSPLAPLWNSTTTFSWQKTWDYWTPMFANRYQRMDFNCAKCSAGSSPH